MFTRAESTKVRERPLFGDDVDPPAVLAHPLVLDEAGGKREEGVVASDADAVSRGEPAPALAHEDGARVYGLTRVDLHAKHLRFGVAPVAGGPAAFLVRHYLVSLSVFGFLGARLAGASVLPVTVSSFSSAAAAVSAEAATGLAFLVSLFVFAAGLASVLVSEPTRLGVISYAGFC